mgnify:FL=1
MDGAPLAGIPCTQHAVTDYLIEIENGDKVIDGDDDLPDDAILQVSTGNPGRRLTQPEDKWFLDMNEFLSTVQSEKPSTQVWIQQLLALKEERVQSMMILE